MKKYKFTINGGSYDVVVKDIEGDVATVEVNGSLHSVKINSEVKAVKTPKLVRKAIENKPGENTEKMAPRPVNSRPSSKTIKSPLPGSVLKVLVGVGDTFKEGDVLMVMESMKMENNILAERAGTVVRICAQVGKAVLQDEALFEFE